MAIIGSDGLSLLVGDGGGPEVFTLLKGASVTKLDLTQQAHAATAIATDAWQVQAGASHRQVVVDCNGYASDDAQAIRVKSLAFSGLVGNFKLQLRSSETLVFSALVTQYRENFAPGEVKKMQFRLESSGAATLV